jgi:hypothetical protein
MAGHRARSPAQGGVGEMRLFVVGVFDYLVEFSLEVPPLRLLRRDTMQEDR